MRRRAHPLVAVLVSTSVAVSAAVSWLGWRLLEQQLELEERRAQVQIESRADGVAGRIRAKLAETSERLGTWLSEPATAPPTFGEGVVLMLDEHGVAVSRSAGLPFVPVSPPAREADESIAAIESAEFQNRLEFAAERYTALAVHRDERVRAGALLRLGGVLRNMRQFRGALEAYEKLAGLGSVRTGGLPAELAGLLGQRAVLLAVGRHDDERRIRDELVRGLNAGWWLLSRGTAEMYFEELGDAPSSDAWRLACVLDDVWRAGDARGRARLQRVAGRDGEAVLVMGRSNGARTALLAVFMDQFLEWPEASGATWQLTDAEGQRLSGSRAEPVRAATRLIGSPDHPMTLHLWEEAPVSASQTSRNFVKTMIVSMVVFIWSATYFMARSLRREAAVARLQSEFVAAVSHEFRSPLTTVRQMVEMLEMGRITSDDRRQVYYRTLAGEAARLQRLVEGLLNFGRMEAGVERYRFAELDVQTLIEQLVREMEPCAREARTRIEVAGPAVLMVTGDEAALKLAIGNLVDNAIKYSPGQPSIEVRWTLQQNRVVVSVIDRGMGIPRTEQRAIFGKFTRGRAAMAAGIRGTGIGLSLVREVARAHGGEVAVDSEPGRGSVFTLSLPAYSSRAFERSPSGVAARLPGSATQS